MRRPEENEEARGASGQARRPRGGRPGDRPDRPQGRPATLDHAGPLRPPLPAHPAALPPAQEPDVAPT